MTEQEYINATNLAKLRTMQTILHNCMPMHPDEQGYEMGLRLALAKWINFLEPIVRAAQSK